MRDCSYITDDGTIGTWSPGEPEPPISPRILVAGIGPEKERVLREEFAKGGWLRAKPSGYSFKGLGT